MLAQESRAAAAAVTFLTRIPIGVELDADDVARSGLYFPVVGAAIGALTGAMAGRTTPALALTTQTVLTGALHLDALADSADSLGTGDRERALEIMRDSRIGSFGTAAVCLDLLIKATALGDCPQPARASISAGALSRAVPVLLSAALPYARPSGTGAALSAGHLSRAACAAGVAVAISRDVGAVAVAGMVALGSAAFWRRRLGGVTGDTLGASIELAESAVLVWNARRSKSAGGAGNLGGWPSRRPDHPRGPDPTTS